MPDLRESIIQALKDEGFVVLSPEEFEEKMVGALASFRTALNIEPEKKKGKKWSYAAKMRLKERRAGKMDAKTSPHFQTKRASDIAMRCLKAIADGNHWQTQIAETAKISTLGLALRLQPLLTRGWVTKPKPGYYEITNEGREALEGKGMSENNEVESAPEETEREEVKEPETEEEEGEEKEEDEDEKWDESDDEEDEEKEDEE